MAQIMRINMYIFLSNESVWTTFIMYVDFLINLFLQDWVCKAYPGPYASFLKGQGHKGNFSRW